MRFFRQQAQPEVITDPGYPSSGARRVGDAPYDRGTCPYCEVPLDPMPKAKKKCPTCGQPIYVRSGPNGMRYLLREADLDAHQTRWDAYYDARGEVEDAEHNRDAAKLTAESVAYYRAHGIIWVMVYRSDDACPACAAIPRECAIDDAPPIPVPGCSNGICRCVISPLVDR